MGVVLLLAVVVVDKVLVRGVVIDVLVIARSVVLLRIVVIVGKIDAISLRGSLALFFRSSATFSLAASARGSAGNDTAVDPLLPRKAIKGNDAAASVVAFDAV